jgi:acyl-CoA ligase (AMP-forming) (exosortase A-associated)
MIKHLGDLARARATDAGDNIALIDRAGPVSYTELADAVGQVAAGLRGHGIAPGERVAVLLDKRRETVAALLGCLSARCVFVPVNPVLKAQQVRHILADSGARALVTSHSRHEALGALEDIALTVLADADGSDASSGVRDWHGFLGDGATGWALSAEVLETDLAGIFYTSGSTGKPKGVAVTNRNLVAGAFSVAGYLENQSSDTILAALPLSFDAGFSQLSTALASGATVVLHNYLLARDMARACTRHKVTGITAVPPLWFQLLQAEWTDEARANLRYFANTGGHMPRPTLERLRALFPQAAPYLMYGLTEAFRSTYLPPAEVDRRPDSIGKAIPNADVLVVGRDGKICAPGEPGELVHCGPLVARGYWNDPERTAERFRPAPGLDAGTGISEPAVWSGDMVRADADGYLYFLGRSDDMIKTMGYRVSPTEVEEIALAHPGVSEAAAFGVPHPDMGQAIILAVVGTGAQTLDHQALDTAIRRELPAYMVPAAIDAVDGLPRSPNGKIDRRRLSDLNRQRFQQRTDDDAPGH